MDRDRATALLDALHAAQNEFYAGGSDVRLRRLLAPEIVWSVPGASRIAGTYQGIDEVCAYFAHRRDLASGRLIGLRLRAASGRGRTRARPR